MCVAAHPGKFLALCCLFVAGSTMAAWSMSRTQSWRQLSDQPDQLKEDEIAKLRPGLTLRFLDSKSAVLDARRVRLAALHVPAGSSHSTLLPAGRFIATLTGLLKLDLNDEAKFKIVGSGDAALAVNGKTVVMMKDGAAKESAVIELVQGFNKVEIRYTSPSQGDATLRVYWSGDEFGWEPLPTDRLFSRGDEADLTAGINAREGRLLFATHGCAQCHGLPGKITVEQCQMPEMRQRAPSLENAGNRFSRDWIAEWVTGPRVLRPEATMPSILQGSGASQQAVDLAAYLASLKSGKTLPPSKHNAELNDQGEQLFLSLGCSTCHTLEKPNVKDAYNRLSLHFAGAEFAQTHPRRFCRRRTRIMPGRACPTSS